MKKEQREKLLKAINILSQYSGKKLNYDIPMGYCDVIWNLIEFAQFHIRQDDFNKSLTPKDKEIR